VLSDDKWKSAILREIVDAMLAPYAAASATRAAPARAGPEPPLTADALIDFHGAEPGSAEPRRPVSCPAPSQSMKPDNS
jgi:hypothetical protein